MTRTRAGRRQQESSLANWSGATGCISELLTVHWSTLEPGDHCAVLASPDVLQRVVKVLSDTDCKSLRSTCRQLRMHPAFLLGVHTVSLKYGLAPDHRRDMDYLAQLPALMKVKVCEPGSLFHLHRLSNLTSLRYLSIQLDRHVVDLMPLACLPQLQTLSLFHTTPYSNLHVLTQLTGLKLKGPIHQAAGCAISTSPSGLGLAQLSSLQRLHISHGFQAASSLAALSCLSRLEVGTDLPHNKQADCWGPKAVIALLKALHELPELVALKVRSNVLPGAFNVAGSHFSGLTALCLSLCQRYQAPCELDFTPLSRLQRLGLISAPKATVITSASATCLYLEADTTTSDQLPDLTAMCCLQHLMINLCEEDMHLHAADVPQQRLTVTCDWPYGLHFEASLLPRLLVLRNQRLSFWSSVEDGDQED